MALTNVTDTIDGLNFLIKVDGKTIGLQTDGSLNIERETKEVKYKSADRSSSIWTKKTAGLLSWNISQSAYSLVASGDSNIASFRDLFAKMKAADNYEVSVVMEYSDGTDDLTYTGQAIITNLTWNLTGVGEDSTFSCTLDGTDALVEAEAPTV
ncbi:phage tail tube protein [Carboxylicivirga sp. RSCT41]|uniref:phage tail tube protein n=1 Tax=Carboxylicivirga agarovorans TaxID=3417570 RepID=UPI003D3249C7